MVAALVGGVAAPASAQNATVQGRSCSSVAFAGVEASAAGTVTFTLYNRNQSPNSYVRSSTGSSANKYVYAYTKWTSHEGGTARSSATISGINPRCIDT